jgi:hypothetical protein
MIVAHVCDLAGICAYLDTRKKTNLPHGFPDAIIGKMAFPKNASSS